MDNWVLTLAFWLHMGATVIWIGGLFFQAAILTPALNKHIHDEKLAIVFLDVRRRFAPLAWLSLTTLVVTGLIQMTENPNYEGLVAITNKWSAAMLAKHLSIVGMIGVAIIQTWVVQPNLARAALLQAKRPAKAPGSTNDLHQMKRLQNLNLILGLLVLVLTSVARTA